MSGTVVAVYLRERTDTSEFRRRVERAMLDDARRRA